MGLIFRFLGEKLDAVREVAADVLESFLHSQDPPLDLIPDKPIVLGCLASIQKRMTETQNRNPGKPVGSSSGGGPPVSVIVQSHGRWTQSRFVYTFLTGILDSNHFFKAVVSGIVISIGALSEGIGKESFNALLHWCQVQNSVRNVRDLSLLASALLELYQDNARNSRVTLPVMKSLHSLLKNDVFNPILLSAQSTASPFAASFGMDLLRCVQKELHRCTEMAKIRAGVDLCLLLLMLDEPVRSSTWKTLLTMTGHRYPKIRKYVAELLYVQLISDSTALGPSAAEVKAMQERDALLETKEKEKGKRYLAGLAPNQEALDRAMEILTTTVWDEENVTMAREKRQSLCATLQIELALKPSAGSGERRKAEGKVDELDSYDSLVRDAGY
jgi:tubulin-specific chaperone D